MADYDPSGLYYRGARYLTGRVFDPNRPRYTSNVWSDYVWDPNGRMVKPAEIIARRGATARGFRDGFTQTGFGLGGAVLVSALSLSDMLYRPKPFKEKSYHLRFPSYKSKWNPEPDYIPDPNDYITYPTNPPPLVRQNAKYGDDQFVLQPESESKSDYPPLRHSHHKGCYEDLSADSHYLSRMPHERTVNLHTVFNTSGYYDNAEIRSLTITLNTLYNSFSQIQSFAIAGTCPVWNHDAAFWNTFYYKHHVEGFKLIITEMPHGGYYTSEVSTALAYVDDGFGSARLALATVGDCSDWASQKYARSQIHSSWNSYLPTKPNFTFEWDINCARDFGCAVSTDNRLDENNVGTMVVPGDPKYYHCHLGWYKHQNISAHNAMIKIDLIQTVKFYDPVSSIHA